MYLISRNRFTGIYDFSGIFDVTLNLPLFPVGLLLRLLSEAVRGLLPSTGSCFPIQVLVYSFLSV